MAVKSEMVANPARAMEMLESEIDQKKQTQWAPMRSPVPSAWKVARRERRRKLRAETASQRAMARAAIPVRQKTREGASIEMMRPRTAVNATMKTRMWYWKRGFSGLGG